MINNEELYRIVMQMDKQKEMYAKDMFNKLKKHIGEDVIFTRCQREGKITEIVELKGVNDFISINVDDYGYPFIGKTMAISSIISRDGERLYYNPNIKDKYVINSDVEMYEIQIDSFGMEVTDELLNYRNSWIYDDEEETFTKNRGRK